MEAPITSPNNSNPNVVPAATPESAPLSGTEIVDAIGVEAAPTPGSGVMPNAPIQTPIQPTPPQPAQPAVDPNLASAGVPNAPAPNLAADVDLIEPEWVEKAEGVVKQYAGDPHGEEEAIEALQEDYLKKRYGFSVQHPDNGAAPKSGSV